jgi:hypothetical protein
MKATGEFRQAIFRGSRDKSHAAASHTPTAANCLRGRKMRIGLIVTIVGFVLWFPHEACAFQGECYLSVQQGIYLDGPCNIELQPDGSFSIGAADSARSRYFAYIEIDQSTGTATGSWNGVAAESHADDDLGTLVRKGGCWINSAAKVCAWRFGTRPSSF